MPLSPPVLGGAPGVTVGAAVEVGLGVNVGVTGGAGMNIVWPMLSTEFRDRQLAVRIDSVVTFEREANMEMNSPDWTVCAIQPKGRCGTQATVVAVGWLGAVVAVGGSAVKVGVSVGGAGVLVLDGVTVGVAVGSSAIMNRRGLLSPTVELSLMFSRRTRHR